MTDDLLAFLRARLDEDEQAARKAAALCGCHPESPSWSFGDESTDGRILVVDDPHPDVRRKLNRRWNGSYEGLFAAEHITRHDPARVLREIEAKQRIIALHDAEPGQHPDFCWHDKHQLPCPTLRLLALPYADQPDYREEWRP